MASKPLEGMSSTESSNPIFPLARFCYHGPLRHYYPFGNVPAEDFLENCIKVSHPSVLVLGCGDMRSCFYTLWKNFDISISDDAPKRFEGVKFVMNDCNPSIIARNLVFLYMCLQLPEEKHNRTEWLSAMWAIWYCHELYPNHGKLLNSTLHILIKFSASLEKWCSSGNILNQLVLFTSSQCLSEVANAWKMWLNKSVKVDSIKSMQDSREDKIMRNSTKEQVLLMEEVITNTHVYGTDRTQSSVRVDCQIKEMRSYFNTGSCFAEEVLDMPLTNTSRTEINMTMYDNIEGRYTCHYALVPFQCYFHAVQFSTESVSLKKSMSASNVIVPSQSFEASPYLSNSFQQFAIWLQSSSRILKKQKDSFQFIFDCRDAIMFCQEQYHKKCDLNSNLYDIITTSNLVDHIGLPNLVLASIPLLSKDGLLVTSTLKMKATGISGEEFLKMSFGFSSEYLPCFLGVRCISHDGDYSNPVFIKSALPDCMSLCSPLRIFLWTKVTSSQNLVLSKLPQRKNNNLTDAVIKACTSCSYSMLRSYGTVVFISIGIETAMAMLKCLISQCDVSVHNYSYWEPVCTALRATVKPYLLSLQTQMLVHGIHAHLVVDEENCPLCNSTALNQVLELFCFKLDLTHYEGSSMNFMAYLHRSTFIDSNDLLRKAEEGEDVHIFDSFEVTTDDDFNLQLKFFAPRHLMEKNYNITVIIVQKQKKECFNKVAVINTTSLHTLQRSRKEYEFYPIQSNCISTSDNANDLFGKVTSHIVDGSYSNTNLALTEAGLKCLDTSKLKLKQFSYNTICIYSGSMKFYLSLPFPINYDKVKLSKADELISITCPRRPFALHEERPCYIVSPDHTLSIIQMQLKKEEVEALSQIQFSQKEMDYCEKTPSYQRTTPLLNVKFFLAELLKNVCAGVSLYRIQTDKNETSCIILVNQMFHDYNHRIPAVDLAFCTLRTCDESQLQIIHMKLLQQFGRTGGKVKRLTIEIGEFLQEVLWYFADRTHGNIIKKGHYSLLYQHDVESFFTRAVVYYLSTAPGKWQWDHLVLKDNHTSTKSKCAKCGKRPEHSKNVNYCKQCNCIQYCSKKCQTFHYFDHIMLCDFIRIGLYKFVIYIPHFSGDVKTIKMD